MSFLGYGGGHNKETGETFRTAQVPETGEFVVVKEPTPDEIAQAKSFLESIHTKFNAGVAFQSADNRARLLELIKTSKASSPFYQVPVLDSYSAMQEALLNNKKFEAPVYKDLAMPIGGHKVWFSWSEKTDWQLYVS